MEAMGRSFTIWGQTSFSAEFYRPGVVQMPIPPDLLGRWQVEEDFVAAIRGQRSVTLTTFADGMKYMCFTEAVYRSAMTGSRCHIHEVWPGS